MVICKQIADKLLANNVINIIISLSVTVGYAEGGYVFTKFVKIFTKYVRKNIKIRILAKVLFKYKSLNFFLI